MRLSTSTVLMGASTLTGALMLFNFNPIQSARPVFARHDTPMLRAIDEERRPDGVLVLAGFPGAVLNGLGHASMSHVTPVPALDMWRQRYPALPEDRFMAIFNRYSHIRLSDGSQPVSPQLDTVDVPLRDYWPGRVELPAIHADVVPTWLSSGPRVTGRLNLPRARRIEVVQVLIGNGNGSADGWLHLRVCEPVAQVCASGRRALRETADNAYATVTLDRSVTLAATPTALTYSLWTEGARTPVALLTQPAAGPDVGPFELDGVPSHLTARFRIDLEPIAP